MNYIRPQVEHDEKVTVTLGNGKRVMFKKEKGALYMNAYRVVNFPSVVAAWEIAGLIDMTTAEELSRNITHLMA